MQNNLIFIYELNKMDIFFNYANMEYFAWRKINRKVARHSHILIDGSAYMKMYKVFLLKYDFTP